MGAEHLIAVDPAARCFAWAHYHDGVLVECGSAVVQDLPGKFQYPGAQWTIETPQNYATFGVAHADLDRLRATVQSIEHHAKGIKGKVTFTKPFSWKGNVPKQIHHRRVHALLTEAEQALLSPVGSKQYDHNVYDAVALGLWAVGRVGRGGRKTTDRR